MSHPNWRVRLQRDYKELPRNYLSQSTGPNLATGSFQEQTCKERENIKATLWKWKQVFGIILEMFFWVYNFPKDSLLINNVGFVFLTGKDFLVALLCIWTLTEQAAEGGVCGVIGVPLGIVGGRCNPVLLRTTGWGWKTFGAVTAIQLCRRERNTFTCKPILGITNSVNVVKLQDTAPIFV